MKKLLLLPVFIFYFFISNAGLLKEYTTGDYIIALKKVTDIMVNDATSPVAASRYYAYITITANEVQSSFNKKNMSLTGKLNGYTGINIDSFLLRKSHENFAVIYAIFKMGEKLLPSGYMLASHLDSVDANALTRGLTKDQVDNSKLFVNDLLQQIFVYVKEDGFTKLSGLQKYTPLTDDAYWQPTAPVFMQAIEPHWNTLRTFIIDSANQFKPAPPVSYDTTRNSAFYKLMYGVYAISKSGDRKQKEIAMFWDCNPFAVQQIGHVEFALKKISPGGHWMGIAGISCLQKKISFQCTVFIHTMLAITLADAFISCWDEKYRSNRVRPETVINKILDPGWRPLLQTPPFPEYTSGHSVISSAAAVVLTKLVGNNISFYDDTEIEFGLKKRYFRSFKHAAEEAAISRFYGGIHYSDAIENGRQQGKSIGKYIIHKLNL